MAKLRVRGRIFFSRLFYYCLAAIILTIAFGQFNELFFILGTLGLGLLGAVIILDIILLFYVQRDAIEANREIDEKFSNGDLNKIQLFFANNYRFPVRLSIIDEIPVQFQQRNFNLKLMLTPGQSERISYDLRPVERGEYHFGALNILVQSPLRIIVRRWTKAENQMAKVYPSFKEMKQFEMMAISNRLTEFGIKKVRKLGHQMEFDQIRDYIKGDDIRTINWKATARRNHLMVNQYREEKSQQVISIIDLGRAMKMPFEGMTLLDYAINTSLVMSKIAMLKEDKAGLITFNNEIRTVVPPQRSGKQMQIIMEALYNQLTGFQEPNLRALYTTIRRQVHHRSLLIIYTNFESLSSAKRQIPMLQKMAKDHLVMVVFFENTELRKLTEDKATDMEGIYVKTIAEKFAYDKKLVVHELERHGVHTILTEPGKLTVETINKYLELKARGLI
ncbi:DUF58 domain-containing protein [Carboxylicivirga caseinilyticus]|uniref:DUF58 domain-containing protein n=1 Tax=Carboxylicivirga caseinilyticus TaxID=3417572 RepID=UPI003D358045|nr:DUF58 domain-containing protein [Marinilabiliaceae bacterium A049]